jgi:tetratricopeptide (TPR) repeat protein
MLRGRVQLARREYASALAENRRAVELNPTFAAAYCGLGDSLCYEGRYDEAIDQFERSVALGAHDPQRWAFLSYGALALLFAGRFDEALEWADRAAALPNCQYWATAHRLANDSVVEADAVCACGGRAPSSRSRAQEKSSPPARTIDLYLGAGDAGVPAR